MERRGGKRSTRFVPLALAMLTTASHGCFSLQNPYDQALCKAGCPNGQHCFAGRCVVATDGGPSDALLGDAPATCNNNDNLDPGEQCDGDKLGGASCATLGYLAGSLSCSDRCTFQGCSLQVLGTASALAASGNVQREPSAATLNGQFTIVWQEQAASGGILFAARLSKLGQLLDSQPLRFCASESVRSSASIASGDGSYAVVWQEIVAGNTKLAGAILPLTLSPANCHQSLLSTSTDPQRPALLPRALGFELLWDAATAGAKRAAFSAQRNSDLTSKDVPTEINTDAGDQISIRAVATAAGARFAVWQNAGAGQWDIGGALSATSVTPLTIAQTAATETVPDVATSGQDVLVVWRAEQSGDQAIFARGYRADGTPQGQALIVDSWAQSVVSAPRVRYFNGEFWLAWVRGTTLHLQRVDANGQLKASRVTLRQGVAVDGLALTAMPDALLVAWGEGQPAQIYRQVISR